MKQTTAVIGSQWGDEGKGKVVDRFARQADWVVRYQGGNNAGHTVVVEDQKYVLHLIPSGILHESARSLIGPGLVVNLRELAQEIEMLEDLGVSPENRLYLAKRAHVLFPFHQFRDVRTEESRGEDKIGTTGKGIGPAYEDKVRRIGLRVCDLADEDHVRDYCRRTVESLGSGWGSFADITADELADEYLGYYERIREFVIDAPAALDEAYRNGEKILFEGAQGTLLDIDFGTYPYVTSSNPTVGGVVTGSGFPGHRIEDVVGLVKAYTTRVGEGPFPTELHDEMGEWLQDKGGEFGATTGRPRRCGWLDLKLLQYSTRVNGFTGIALSKMDILSGLDRIKVGIGYKINGEDIPHFPADTASLSRIDPVYQELEGWEKDITDCRHWDELPPQARHYVNFIEEYLDVPVPFISVGPGREQLIVQD